MGSPVVFRMKATQFFHTFHLFSIISSVPQKYGWIYPEEECSKVHTKALEICLKRNKVPDIVNFKCGTLNYQNGCKVGKRRVIHVTDTCISTKCIPNISGDKICKNGEVPYDGRCHKIGSSNVCAKRNDLVPKRVLEADMFGNVRCNCLASHGFVQYNEDCYSESSFTPCNPVGSSQNQLIRLRDDNIGKCFRNKCGKGQLMWRRSNCLETKYSCFECKQFDEHVHNCNTRLILKNDVVTCASMFSYNEAEPDVFAACSEQTNTTGECSEFGEKLQQATTYESILRSLCKVNR